MWNALPAKTAPPLRAMAAAHWRALTLALNPQDQGIPARHSWVILVLHLFGLFAIIRLTHQPFWIGLVPLLLVQPLVVSFKIKRLYLFPESLAPFVIAYVIIALRLLIAILARVQGLTSGSLIVPSPWGELLNMDLAITLSAVWALAAQAGPATQVFGKRVHWGTALGCLLLGTALIWSGITYFHLRASGVTASDPYAYVQMAVDLAQRGTLLHTFGWVPSATEWGLPLWPLVPIGYGTPNPLTGTAATVWPPGYSAFLAIAYWLLGEPGLYCLTPLLGLATLLALWFLCLEVLRQWPGHGRFLGAGFAVLILATSYQQIDRLVVPMADIPSQLFSTLAILFALYGARKQKLLVVCLSGLCLGIAFAIRYTQVLLAAGVLAAVLVYAPVYRPHLRRELVRLLGGCGVSAGLAALPVLWYHQVAFGSPLGVGSSELKLFGWEHIPATFVHVSDELLRTNEFLFVILFVAWGAFCLWRNSKQASGALLAWLLAVVLFHLPYQALRLRDLMSIFPVLALSAGAGIAEILGRPLPLCRPAWPGSVKILALGLVIVALWIRTATTWQLSISTDFYTFGYLSAEQRSAFTALANLTVRDGIIAASLNSGPIVLYADRVAVRPGYWSDNEWLSFVAHVLADGQTVYVLMDSDELERPLRALQSHYHLIQRAWLNMPYFPQGGGGSINRAVALYELIP